MYYTGLCVKPKKISKTNVFKTSEVIKIVRLILLTENKIFKLVYRREPSFF